MPELPEVETVRRVLEPQLAGVVAWGIEGDAMIPEEYLRGQGKEYRNAERLKPQQLLLPRVSEARRGLE